MFIECTFTPISVHFIAYENVLPDKYTSMNLLIKNQTHRLKERKKCMQTRKGWGLACPEAESCELWMIIKKEPDMRGKTLTVRLSPVLSSVLCLSPCGRVHYALYSSAPSKIFSALSLSLFTFICASPSTGWVANQTSLCMSLIFGVQWSFSAIFTCLSLILPSPSSIRRPVCWQCWTPHLLLLPPRDHSCPGVRCRLVRWAWTSRR